MKNNDVQLVDFVESEFLGEQVDFFKKKTRVCTFIVTSKVRT